MRWIETLDSLAPGASAPTAWIVPPAAPPPALPAPRPEDLEHAARRRDPARRAATLDRRLRLRALAARVLGVDPADVAVAQTPTGAPFIAAPRPLHAALAARDGWSLVVAAPEPVGADVERVEAGAHPPLDLLHPALAVRLAAADDRAFTAAWAAVEAHLKRTGEGVEGVAGVRLDGATATGDRGDVSVIAGTWRGDVVFACATPARDQA